MGFELTPARLNVGLVVVALTVILFLTALTQDDPQGGGILKQGSSYFTDGPGYRGMFEVAEVHHPDARRWRRDPTTLIFEEGYGGTLFLAAPTARLQEHHRDALRQWVEGGGQLILALERDWDVVASLSTALSNLDIDEESFGTKGFLGSFGVEIERIEQVHRGNSLFLKGQKLQGEGLETRLAEGNRGVIAAAIGLGEGRILVLADSEAFSNRRLKQNPGNAYWLLKTSMDWGGPLLFNEYHHNFVDGRLSTATNVYAFLFSKWGVGVIQLIVLAALLVWGPWRRFGSIVPVKMVSRHDPLELVRARAGLFKTAKAVDLSFTMIHRGLLRRFTTPSGGNPFDDPENHGGALMRSTHFQDYLELYHRHREGRTLDEQQLFAAAALAGRLLEEFHHESSY